MNKQNYYTPLKTISCPYCGQLIGNSGQNSKRIIYHENWRVFLVQSECPHQPPGSSRLNPSLPRRDRNGSNLITLQSVITEGMSHYFTVDRFFLTDIRVDRRLSTKNYLHKLGSCKPPHHATCHLTAVPSLPDGEKACYYYFTKKL